MIGPGIYKTVHYEPGDTSHEATLFLSLSLSLTDTTHTSHLTHHISSHPHSPRSLFSLLAMTSLSTIDLDSYTRVGLYLSLTEKMCSLRCISKGMAPMVKGVMFTSTPRVILSEKALACLGAMDPRSVDRDVFSGITALEYHTLDWTVHGCDGATTTHWPHWPFGGKCVFPNVQTVRVVTGGRTLLFFDYLFHQLSPAFASTVKKISFMGVQTFHAVNTSTSYQVLLTPPLSQYLKVLTSLQLQIHLNPNEFNMLCSSPSLVDLDLSSSRCSSVLDVVHSFATPWSPTLRSLSLPKDFHLGFLISPAFMYNSTITKLVVGQTTQFEPLLATVANISTLTHLDLSWYHIRGYSGCDIHQLLDPEDGKTPMLPLLRVLHLPCDDVRLSFTEEHPTGNVILMSKPFNQQVTAVCLAYIPQLYELSVRVYGNHLATNIPFLYSLLSGTQITKLSISCVWGSGATYTDDDYYIHTASRPVWSPALVDLTINQFGLTDESIVLITESFPGLKKLLLKSESSVWVHATVSHLSLVWIKKNCPLIEDIYMNAASSTTADIATLNRHTQEPIDGFKHLRVLRVDRMEWDYHRLVYTAMAWLSRLLLLAPLEVLIHNCKSDDFSATPPSYEGYAHFAHLQSTLKTIRVYPRIGGNDHISGHFDLTSYEVGTFKSRVHCKQFFTLMRVTYPGVTRITHITNKRKHVHDLSGVPWRKQIKGRKEEKEEQKE
jgi:hypothetical protein